jgi:hypothetical protein
MKPGLRYLYSCSYTDIHYPPVEAGSNTSTVTLRVVRGDKKGSLKSETVKYGRVPRESDQRKIALARASSIYKRQTPPLIREGFPQEQDVTVTQVIKIWS